MWYAMSPITTHNWTRNAEARLIPPFLSGPQTLCACGDGMGSVYRAVDTRLGRKVAIKICAQQFTGRFEREARAISSLNHPHICTLYDVGPQLSGDGAGGKTLAARVQKGRLPMAAVLRYATEIANALAAAHALGIIHRDLKPQNIMITKSGVKVLAAACGGDTRI